MKIHPSRPRSCCSLAPGDRARAPGRRLVARDVPARRAVAPAPRFDLVGLHWQGSGAVSFRTRARRGPLERLARRGARGRGRPTRARTSCAARGWQLGNPYWTGPSNRLAGAARFGRVTPGARVLRLEPGRQAPRLRAVSIAGSPLILSRLELGRERADPPRHAELRRRGPVRGRPPHGRLEHVHAGAVGRDRPRHPALPRARERLGRHRLQLSRRQVRPGLRGPLRGSRPERRRRARAGVQHGLGRRRADRELRRGDTPTAAARSRAGAPARLAARRRARRPAVDASTGARRGTRASRPGRRSRCARSPAIGTRATRPAPAAASTASCLRSRAPSRRSGCRSSTPRA